MSNFLFLKKSNQNLFNIISDAENLFRDEYFEQSVVQTRRFAENLCRSLLEQKALPDDTFDDMINKIKDNSFDNIRMQELSDDLYFLKKHGNSSAHSSSSNQNAKVALECLERAFEIAIFYSNIKEGYNKNLDKQVFSEELLITGKVTGKKSKPKTLKERYSKELSNHRNNVLKVSKKPKKDKKSQNCEHKSNKKNSTSIVDFLKAFLTVLVLAILSIAIFIYR